MSISVITICLCLGWTRFSLEIILLFKMDIKVSHGNSCMTISIATLASVALSHFSSSLCKAQINELKVHKQLAEYYLASVWSLAKLRHHLVF